MATVEHVSLKGDKQDNNNADEDDSMNTEDDSSDEEDAQVDIKIREVEKEISKNPYLYDKHVELIKLLRKEGDLEKLRQARSNMSNLFPLTEELWLEWFQDEIPLISTDSDRERVTSLFEKAVKDYLSVPLWLEYVQYAIGGMGPDGKNIENIRATFEKALTATGLHVTSGAAVWETYREFENALLSSMQAAPGSVLSAEQQKSVEEQTNRVTSLFKRQLAVPLFDMENTYEELKEWLETDIDQPTKHAYEKALKKFNTIKNLYETSLEKADSPKLAEYNEYIAYELKLEEPPRIQCIYERALQENCLDIDLWINYTNYLSNKLKVYTLAQPAYERAVRNCPWSAKLWLGYGRILERNMAPHTQIIGIFEQALSSGINQAQDCLSLWFAYCDYLRRRIKWSSEHDNELADLKNVLQRSIEYQAQYFGNDGDPQCNLQQYWARMEAKHCNNMTRARELWADIMQSGNSTVAQMWLDFYSLERFYGDAKHVRKLFQRAVNSVHDWPESVCQAYINYEREEGDLDQYDLAVSKCEIQLQRCKERRAKEIEQEEQKKQKHKDNKFKPNKNAPVFTRQGQGQKRKTDDEHTFKVPAPPVQKARPNSEKGSREHQFKVPVVPPPGWKEGPPPSKKIKEDDHSRESSDRGFICKKELTVFVSNLDFNLSDSRLSEVFKVCGIITDIRVVKNNGKSRGFGYVEFQSEDSVHKALQLDRQPIDGRPMYVSPCQDRQDKSGAQFKFSTDMEKNKLFIKNLPFTCTKESLQNIFSQYGKLKEVRIVTYRSGAPKGLAYVEYENEVDASQAVLKTDGLLVGEHKIEVAISCPPQRKTTNSSFTPSLGGGKKESVFGKARTKVSLVPRSLTNPSTETKDKPQSKMNNAQFRDMLLKK